MTHHALPLLLLLTISVAPGATAQQRPPGSEAEPALALDAARRGEVVDSIATLLKRMYVFPDVAERMITELHSRAAQKEFADAADAASFARSLTTRLRAVSHDKHLRVRVGEPRRRGAPPGEGGRASSDSSESRPRPARTGMYGRTERLDGGVAYIEIASFAFPPEVVRDETREVMSAAADANALIIDVRSNGGGSPFTVALVCSYLFGDDPVLLNSLYYRPADRTDDFYTDPRVPGRKFGRDKPVYVLTSDRTFSGAEEFAYDLQTRKRATIVGETTGGGANPGELVPLPHGLGVFVPTGRAINPITKTNWEGVGVKPDVAVSAGEALETALRLAQRLQSR
ncbi:MAG TPA: S41 family peptidase [Gemmatimonadaceae bacterium]|nr:S41 family peptidase [Gemmatimonadaceae bacterium]